MLLRPLLRLVPDKTRINFMRGRIMGLVVSAVLSTASIVLAFHPAQQLVQRACQRKPIAVVLMLLCEPIEFAEHLSALTKHAAMPSPPPDAGQH